MKAVGGGFVSLVMASPRLALMILSKKNLLHCSFSKLCPDVFRGQIDRQGAIFALEVSTFREISIPPFLMGPRTRPRHSFMAGNEFGVL